MFRLVNGGEHLPQRATQHSAGFDVFANEDVVVRAGETATVGLGIALDADSIALLSKNCFLLPHEFMEVHYLELHPRSSLRTKGISVGVGIVDIDYREEIKMVLSNPMRMYGAEDYTLYRGDKIGQLILKRHEGYLLPAQYTLNAERTGGFGSTNEN